MTETTRPGFYVDLGMQKSDSSQRRRKFGFVASPHCYLALAIAASAEGLGQQILKRTFDDRF